MPDSPSPFSPQDLTTIQAHGAKTADLQNIYMRLQAPAQFVPILRAAGQADHLRSLSQNELEERVQEFSQLTDIPGKFTPMSGAASRMFAFVQRWLGEGNESADAAKIEQIIQALDSRQQGPELALAQALDAHLRKEGKSLQERIEAGDHRSIMKAIINKPGLGLATLPKGLIPFHLDDDGNSATALQEHMREAMSYAGAKLHLTISEEHRSAFANALEEIRQQHPELREVEVSFSIQSPGTDSIAIDSQTGDLLRGDDGQLLFFPAGHGALLHNIQQLGKPAVLRNVDNVPRSAAAQNQVTRYHQAFAVLLYRFNKERNRLLKAIDSRSTALNNIEQGIANLRAQGFHILLDAQAYAKLNDDEKWNQLRLALDRPVKIVGVVPNQGEPGGGPFVIDSKPPFVSIVEKDEIAPEQQKLMADGAFFNPVDLVIDPRNEQGQSYDLKRFANPDRAFIVKKNYQGRSILRMEHPGLWNGAMDGWTSLFVVMPIETFAPVKELVDLLRPAHQRQANTKKQLAPGQRGI